MLPYWLLFLIFAAGALQTRSKLALAHSPGLVNVTAHPEAEGASLAPLLAAVIFTAVLIGLRYKVGGDWIPYRVMYEDISRLSFLAALTHTDVGYGLLNWLVSRMGMEIWAVNFSCGALFCFGLIKFARVQPNPWLAIVVAVPFLVIGVAMGYSRQAVAIGFCMAGLAAISRGSFTKFVLWILIAGLFHRTAIVLLPVVAISYAKNRLQTVLLVILAGVIGYYVLLAPALEKFGFGYVQQGYVAQGAAIRLAMNLPPALIFLLWSRQFGLEEEERKVWRNFSIVAVLSFASWFVIESSVILDRLGLYLIPLQLFVISRLPYVFGAQKGPGGGILILVISYSAFVQFIWLNFANHAKYWLPYKIYPLFW